MNFASLMPISKPVSLPKPSHGGDLHTLEASKLGLLDLSSAVSPFTYETLGGIESAWTRLPYVGSSVQDAMARYYKNDCFRLIPGTQWAIEYLPSKLSAMCVTAASCSSLDNGSARLRVALPRYGYAEHAYHWSKLGIVDCEFYDDLPKADLVQSVDVCVVINPNNPTGKVYSEQEISSLMRLTHSANTWLIIDETFVDFVDEVSVSAYLDKAVAERTITLRSFGKFSGLPGARVGALGAHPSVINILEDEFPLWGVTGPSLEVYERVLKDRTWFIEVKQQVKDAACRLMSLLEQHFETVNGKALLFCTVFIDEAPRVAERLVQGGVYVRVLDDEAGLRFSLPANDHQFRILAQALECAKAESSKTCEHR